jgi:hypothetical protein
VARRTAASFNLMGTMRTPDEEEWRKLRNRRARKLLLEHLTWRQWFEFRVWKSFTVRGNLTGHRYRIFPPYYSTIVRTFVGLPRKSFCLLVDDGGGYFNKNMPKDDAMLAKKLVIECNDAMFLLVANYDGKPWQYQGAWR